MTFIAQDVLDQAEKAAHLSDKGLFFLVVILMGGVIAYLFRDAKKTAERVATEHSESMEKLVSAMDAERQERIGVLIEVIKSDTSSKVTMADAINANTMAVRDLHSLINAKLGIPK